MADQLTAEEQTAILAARYSYRAEAYDRFWSPVIRPAGERLLAHLPLAGARRVLDVGTGTGALLPALGRLAPTAVVLGVDRSPGMLELARRRHAGPLALMDAQALAVPGGGFDVAVAAFVLFALPNPERCLAEVHRGLAPGGAVGTVTWAFENLPPATVIWNEELEAAGAHIAPLPETDHMSLCDSPEKMAALLARAGFTRSRIWTEAIEHRWRPEDHYRYLVSGLAGLRLESLDRRGRERCLRRVGERLAGAGEDDYASSAAVVMATAARAR